MFKFKNYKLNQWYKVKDDRYTRIFYAQKYEEGKLYGFCDIGRWTEYSDKDKEIIGYYKNHSIIKATEKEVKDILISEAIKRYSKYDKVNYLDTGKGVIKGRSFIYDDCIVYATDHHEKKDILFKEGEWADVIKTIYLTKKQAEEMITEFKNDGNEYKIKNSIMDYR